MSPARVLALVILAGLISVTPLAYGSPPDPTWIEGIYNDADGDDVIVSLTGAAWVVELAPPVSLNLLFVAVPFAPPASPPIVSVDLHPAPPGRAPPQP
jgi:hypothetical protein